jgi:hypothetical protein
MKEIFKNILKYLFANTKLDEKVTDVAKIVKTKNTKLDKNFNTLKKEIEIPKKRFKHKSKPKNS